MKKFLKMTVLLLLMIVCAFMVSCNMTKTPSESTSSSTTTQGVSGHEHAFLGWTIVKDATCEEEGLRSRTCVVCKKTERESIAAKGHLLEEWKIVKESTCTTEGQKKRVCSLCKFEETEVIPAKGHYFGASIQTAAPNCTDDGERKKICTTCAHEETEVIPANGHSFVDHICSICHVVAPEKAVQTVKIANTSLLLPLNTPVKLDVQIYPADALYTNVTYTIDERNNSCGATITEDGVLSCTQLGSVRVRVTVDNVSSAYVTFNVPTEIRTAEEFDAIRNNLKGYYILCNDIDLSAYSTWTPIGYATKAADGSLSYSGTGFQGEFNGNGYTISGLNIDLEHTNLITVGLFGFVDTSAVVSNIKVEANVIGTASASEYIGTLTGVNYGVIENCEITSDIDMENALYVGGIAGQNNGNLTDCTADVSIKASNSNSNGYYVGGIAGQFVIGNMDNNTVKANIEIGSCNFCHVGGVTGNAYGSFNGTECEATIVISANSNSTSYVGGVVGKVEDSDSEIAFDLNNTTITGSITVNKANKLYVGGIVGYGDVFNNCINDVDITVTSSGETYVGGVAGMSTGISNSQNNGAISVNSTSTVYVGGIVGSTEAVTHATNYSDISVTASKSCIGGVAGEADLAENVQNYCYSLISNAEGDFGGVVGRCTQKIEGAYNTAHLIAKDADGLLYLGGIVGSSSTTGNIVKDVTNSGKIDVDASKLGIVYIGGVAGKADSISNAKNVSTSLSVSMDSIVLIYNAEHFNVGGLCGYSSGSIDNSYSQANIVVENTAKSVSFNYSSNVGGLAGTANNVSGSYATGDVSVSLYNSSVCAGGLVGTLTGTASKSYARGSVTGVTANTIKIGGLVAYAHGSATIQDCYAAYNYLTTNITSNGSTAYVGGLVAHNLGTVTDSYAMNYINTIGSGTSDTIYAGGVIGYNNGTVSKSYSSSATEHVLNTDIPVDIDCTSNLSANVYVGGFVGYNNKTITNCYAGAEVIGRGCYTGGFVGYQTSQGTISYALALASVNSGISGQSHTGGFSGNDAGSYTRCIFSTTGTQIDASNGAGGATVSGIVGKSETELRSTSSFGGFDTSVWTIFDGGIPTLTLNSNWKVYNDGYDNFNVLKNVVNSDRQYMLISDYMAEIKFESNWNLPLLETVVLEKGSKVVMLPDLSAEGYVFIGWFTDAEFTTPFEVDGTYAVNEDITLYAYFRKIIAVPESQMYTYNGEEFSLTTLDLTGTRYSVDGVYQAIDAGEYTVTLTLNANYCWSDGSIDPIDITWEIEKQSVDIPEGQIYTYDGEEHSLTSVDLESIYYTVTGTYAATDAGEYTVTLTLNESCYWSDGSTDPLDITLDIGRRSVDIPEGQIYTYDGEEHSLTSIDPESIYYAVTGTYAATDAGEYTVTLTLNENCYWSNGSTDPFDITLKIEKQSVDIPEGQHYTYDGEEHCLTSIDPESIYYTVTGTYAATDAGEYTVTLTLNENYCWSDGSTDPLDITLEIEKRSVDIPEGQIYTYDGEEHSLTSVDLESIYYTVTGTYAATDAGEYTVTLTLNENYCWSDGSTDPLDITLDIGRRSVDIPEGQIYTYDGEEHCLTSIDPASIYYTVTGTYAATDAGEYTVTLTLNENYCWSDGSTDPLDITLDIGRQSVDIPEGQLYTYDEEEHCLTSIDPESIYYTVTGTYAATNAGTYSVTLTLNENYCWSDGSTDPLDITWEIEKQSVDIPEGQIYTYDGEEHCLTSIDLESIYYTVTGTYAATEAGEYTVTLTLNENYCWSDGSTESRDIALVIPDTSWYNTTDTQFTISNVAQLAGLAQLVNGGNDFKNITINLNNSVDFMNLEWIPIGTSNANFAGIFDGNGYVISNFTITGSMQYAGLFGYNTGTIKNLGVENFTIDVNFDSGSIYAGGLVGHNNGGTITNCYATGDVSSSSSYSSSYSSIYAGGLVGYHVGGTITNCYATGDVSSSSSSSNSSSYAGGLVGFNYGDITNCYATGDVSSSSSYSSYSASYSDSYAGGLVGYHISGTITNCYATGDVSSSSSSGSSYSSIYAGGLVGDNNSAAIKNCYRYDGQSFTVVKGSSTSTSATNTWGTAKTMEELQSEEWVENNLWTAEIDIWHFGEGYPTLDFETINTVLEISTKEDLLKLQGQALVRSYRLLANIDLGEIDWTPISVFYGNFDGNGYVISNFTITGSMQYAGLFGYNNMGTIKDLGVENFTIDVSFRSGSIYAGGLVGYYGNGTITNCYATGDVSSSSSDDDSYAGGLVGYYSNGTITNCYATGDVSSGSSDSSSYAGGLVGYYSNGTITNCYATGDVSSSSGSGYSYSYAGGLVGDNNSGDITNCYATGDVSSSTSSSYSYSYSCAGGLVGYNYYGDITNCYATGDVSSSTSTTAYAGGLVAYKSGGAITNCYRYDGQSFTVVKSSSTSTSATNTKGTAKTMEELQSAAFQTDTLDWSADDWNFVEGEHPALKNVGVAN